MEKMFVMDRMKVFDECELKNKLEQLFLWLNYFIDCDAIVGTEEYITVYR